MPLGELQGFSGKAMKTLEAIYRRCHQRLVRPHRITRSDTTMKTEDNLKLEGPYETSIACPGGTEWDTAEGSNASAQTQQGQERPINEEKYI